MLYKSCCLLLTWWNIQIFDCKNWCGKLHLRYIAFDVAYTLFCAFIVKLHLYIAAIYMCNNGLLMTYYDIGRILNQKKISALQISFERLYPKLKQNWCFQLHNVTGSFSWYCYFDENSIIIVCMIYSMAYFALMLHFTLFRVLIDQFIRKYSLYLFFVILFIIRE